MIIKLQNVYIDDSEDKILIDGYNALHHFMRLEENNEVSIKRVKLTDPVTGRNIDRMELTLSKRKVASVPKPVVKLFDEGRNDSVKESEFKKQKVIFEQIIETNKQKIKELEAKIEELERGATAESGEPKVEFLLKREIDEEPEDNKAVKKRKNSANSD